MVKKTKLYASKKDHPLSPYESHKLNKPTKSIETASEKGYSNHQGKDLTKGTKTGSISYNSDPNETIIDKSSNKKLPVVKESFVSYSQKLTSTDLETNRGLSQDTYKINFTIILSDAAHKPESQMMPLEKMSIVRNGVSKKDLEGLKEKTALDYDKLAKALSVTRATLINKKREEKFNASLSERIVGLADIYSYGYEVFEDGERFNQWMFRPNRALGGQAPYDLIDNQFGREEIRNIIGRIEYGVYS